MYNHKHIATFIEKVNKEAEAAAQSVYDKYLNELEHMIINQLREGDSVTLGMGVCSLKNYKGEEIAEDLRNVINSTQYLAELRVNFGLGDIQKGYRDIEIVHPKVRLSKEVMASLNNNGKATFQLTGYIPCPKTSIIYGRGHKHLWDKIDRVWVYGDCDSYIKDKINVGRRAEDYPNNTVNNWSGKPWYDLYESTPKDIKIGSKINGIYTVTEIKISQLFPKIKYSFAIST